MSVLLRNEHWTKHEFYHNQVMLPLWADWVWFDCMISILLLLKLWLELTIRICTTHESVGDTTWRSHGRVSLINRAGCNLFWPIADWWRLCRYCLACWSRSRPESVVIVCRWWWLKRTPLLGLCLSKWIKTFHSIDSSVYAGIFEARKKDVSL